MENINELGQRFDKEARSGDGCAAAETLSQVFHHPIAAFTITAQTGLLAQQAEKTNSADRSLPQVNVVAIHPHDNSGTPDVTRTHVQVSVSKDSAHFPSVIVNEILEDATRNPIGSVECHNANLKK